MRVFLRVRVCVCVLIVVLRLLAVFLYFSHTTTREGKREKYSSENGKMLLEMRRARSRESEQE